MNYREFRVKQPDETWKEFRERVISAGFSTKQVKTNNPKRPASPITRIKSEIPAPVAPQKQKLIPKIKGKLQTLSKPKRKPKSE